ncbi:MAG: MBL fold metallo-hydrolase RNA specificity domain-containing protein [Candidatus Sericytochromatia bacterium]
MKSSIRIRFLGAAGTVTGSRHVLETPGARVLVDCGQFQGLKALRLRNREPFPIKASSLDAVLLTHGHLDHCGWLPVLMRQGFNGPIYCTGPTRAVAELILRDCGKVQEEEAERANQGGWSRHKPAKPLFTLYEAERCLKHFKTVSDGEWLNLLPGMQIRWRRVSHILGACFIEVQVQDHRILFSGDVGRVDDPLLYPPEKPERADALLLESTYGDRLHPRTVPMEQLHEIASRTLLRGGTLLIPGFAVERMQTLLWLLHHLEQQRVLPRVPVIFDSPMGQHMLDLFKDFPEWHRLDKQTVEDLTNQVHVVDHVMDSLAWAAYREPRIVLAGSGMLTGGRIMNYLGHELGNKDSTILLTGFQAEGTRGRLLQEGAKEIKLQGHILPVKAQIATLDGLSAHADQEGLLDWLSELNQPPEHLFLVHGEPQAAETLKEKLEDRYGWAAHVAAYQETRKLWNGKQAVPPAPVS